MTIEEILDNLNKSGISAVLILKANEGYSVLPVSKPKYRNYFLMKDHFNGETVVEALLTMGEAL